MAEELVMTVKSNIKTVTKETKDWGKTLDNVNESLTIQNKVITDLERDLIKLKAKQDAIPKGGWVAGMDKLNDKIKRTSSELKLEKNALKDLTNQQKEATQEVKKSTVAKKGNNKESKESIANFQFMGVSLNGVKKGFSQIIPTAKAMFGTIKAGIMSTGIGALVLGVIALTQSFKRSEEGQEKFQRIMAGIGAVTSQVLDLFSDLGETIIDAVNKPGKALKSLGNGIVKFLKNPLNTTREVFTKTAIAVKTLVDETKKEVDVLVEVTNMRQKAHHIDRKLKVERAKANREINDIRLQAEDRENKNATERIALLRKAQAIEEGITAKEIKSKQILIDALKLEMEQNKNNIAIKDQLAQLQAELINLDTKKLRSQRLLQTQITTAVNEEKAIKEQAAADAQKIIDDEWDAKIKANDEWNKEQLRLAEEEIALAKKVADTKIAADEAVKKSKQEMASAVGSAIGTLGGLMKEGSAAAKAAALTEIAINTGVGFVQGLDIAQKSAKAAGPGAALAFPIFYAMQVAAVLSAAAQAKQILGAGAGGGGGSVGGGGGAAAPQTPAPQMMSGAFDLTGGVEPEATRAYVLTDEMTNSQNQLANIRRRATI
jgi:hypothetical protein